MNTTDRAALYVAKIPPAVSGQDGHGQLFAVATALLHGFALGEGDAWPILADYNRRCLPPWSESELRHKLRSAAAVPPRRPTGWLIGGLACATRAALPPMRPAISLKSVEADMPKIEQLASKLDGWSEDDLWERSPIRPDTQDSLSFLAHLFRPGEHVAICASDAGKGATNPPPPVFLMLLRMDPPGWHLVAKPMAQPGADKRTQHAWDHAELSQHRHKWRNGVFFLTTPLDGLEHDGSYRKEASATCFRYVLLESDKLPMKTQMELVCQLPLPIASLVTSGGGSLHALWKVDAKTKAEFNERIMPCKCLLKAMGFDPGALSGVRLTRLPGCWRMRNNAEQRLLYLNPNPTETPICELPVRETKAAMSDRLASMIPAFDCDP